VVVDAAHTTLAPGLVNTYLHAWGTNFAGSCRTSTSART
jgi:cytosine/adenosine deaminase-related metal-dependent hydrolase